MAKVLDEQRYNNYTSIQELVSVIIYLIDLFLICIFSTNLVWNVSRLPNCAYRSLCANRVFCALSSKCVRLPFILTASLIPSCIQVTLCTLVQLCKPSFRNLLDFINKRIEPYWKLWQPAKENCQDLSSHSAASSIQVWKTHSKKPKKMCIIEISLKNDRSPNL